MEQICYSLVLIGSPLLAMFIVDKFHDPSKEVKGEKD